MYLFIYLYNGLCFYTILTDVTIYVCVCVFVSHCYRCGIPINNVQLQKQCHVRSYITYTILANSTKSFIRCNAWRHYLCIIPCTVICIMYVIFTYEYIIPTTPKENFWFLSKWIHSRLFVVKFSFTLCGYACILTYPKIHDTIRNCSV